MGFLKGRKEKEEGQQYRESTQEIIDKVKCPYQVFSGDSSVEEVTTAYQKAFVRGKKEGFVPILVQSDEYLAEWLGILEDESYSREAIINQDSRDGEAILKERYAEYTEDYADDVNGNGEVSDEDMLISELMGQMEGGDVISQMISFRKFSGDGIEETILFELPVKKPWEVIAWMPIGGWNECPEASEMMEVCRYWYQKYGAVPAAFTHDTLEFVLENPVEDENRAWTLAKEQYAFCPDRVDQGTAEGTIGEVADSLKKSTVWYFWWD